MPYLQAGAETVTDHMNEALSAGARLHDGCGPHTSTWCINELRLTAGVADGNGNVRLQQYVLTWLWAA